MNKQRPDAAAPRAAQGAKRLLHVLGQPQERPRHGLMQHEFHHAFRSEAWTMADFRAASIYAYQAGWIDLDGNLYRLTERGAEQLRAIVRDAEENQKGS